MSFPDSGHDLVAAIAALVAIGAAAWLAAVSLVCAGAVATRHARLARRAARLGPPFLRRLVELALVASCAAGTALPAGAAQAGADPKPAALPAARRDEPVVRTPQPPEPAATSPTRTPAPTPTPPPAPAPGRVPAAEHSVAAGRTHVVRAGDNLWRIARAELVATGVTAPDDATIARYWERVIAANRATLRSGNPSLIYPGELVALPAVQ
jgi:nucleoid-associated protein YgaU